MVGSDTFNFVARPEHYTKGEVECIDAIRSSMSVEAFCGYCKGNVEKYVWRYREKNGIEDLQKAEVYLTWLITAEKQREAKAREYEEGCCG